MDLIACYDSLEALSRHNPAPERERERVFHSYSQVVDQFIFKTSETPVSKY